MNRVIYRLYANTKSEKIWNQKYSQIKKDWRKVGKRVQD